jgi:hypothetical protein
MVTFAKIAASGNNLAVDSVSVPVQRPAIRPGPGRIHVATFENALALVRFGGFRFGHFGGRGGGSGLLFVIGLVFAGGLIWALTRPRQSAN